jgi:hypothetical protein
MAFCNPRKLESNQPDPFAMLRMWPTCKLARAQYNIADVCYREYEPMESSNKKWSKDELMPKTCTMKELVEKIKLAAPSTFRHLSREEIVK